MGGDTLMTNVVGYNPDGSRKIPISESPSRKGDIAEFYAVTWLWDNGYEVFLNAGSSGPIDIIAFKDGETKLIDVKSGRLDHRNNKVTIRDGRTEEQIGLGVVFLTFDPITRKLSWVNHKSNEDKQLGLNLL